MCGIAGIFDLHSQRDVDRDALRRMADALAHRGPDGEGFFFDHGVGLAHRRLAIIDKAGGAQPFIASNGAVLNYNGEVYNFEALGNTLQQTGVAFKTRSDTEVLAEGLAKKGAGFIDTLRGMFAFAFWDPHGSTLLLARDRFGEKPLYYTETADGFLVFASEIGALRASRLLSFDLCDEAVADYFFYGYTPDPKSIFKGVRKLSPGHTLSIRRGAQPQLSRYWRPRFAADDRLKFDHACDALQEKIDTAVRTQMVSDAPLGAFLSGGVDSAGIVASMAKTGAQPVACTIGFEESSHDERAGAREIAEKFGAEHHEHVARIDADDLIDKVAAAFGEPFADTSALASYIVSGLARQHVTVALSGDGGDELFAGYRRYPFFLAEEKLRGAAPRLLRQTLFGAAGAVYPKLDWAPRFLRAQSTFKALAATRADAYASAVAINAPDRVRTMLSADLKARNASYRSQSVIEAAFNDADTNDPLSAAQYADLTTWLPGRMLVKVDRASMAHGLEARPPLLDTDLAQWAGTLPSAFKLKAGERKRVLKAALTPRLGAEYVNRPKRGFDMPVSAWLRQPDSPLAQRLLQSILWRESGILNVRTIEHMLRAHQSGRSDCGQELWSVLMFDAFLRLT